MLKIFLLHTLLFIVYSVSALIVSFKLINLRLYAFGMVFNMLLERSNSMDSIFDYHSVTRDMFYPFFCKIFEIYLLNPGKKNLHMPRDNWLHPSCFRTSHMVSTVGYCNMSESGILHTTELTILTKSSIF